MREFTTEERAEIMRAYSERGVSSAKMIGILADLHLCSRTDIKRVLGLAVAPKKSHAGGRGARWTEDETERLLALYAQTQSATELARLMGLPYHRVRAKLHNLDAEGRLPRPGEEAAG